ncbi:hypothetical protein SSPIM334S_01040 [Streptomyces spiroverticillatus]|nr:hypothetical protein [Streptomyces finlayi]
MGGMVVAGARYAEVCPGCGAQGEWSGAQVLLEGDGRLRWDAEFACAACGEAMSSCGGEVPPGVRELLLAADGAATVSLPPDTRSPAAMRVLRASLGLDLASVRPVLEAIRHKTYVCTLPEAELLARQLREAGVAAVAERLGDARGDVRGDVR